MSAKLAILLSVLVLTACPYNPEPQPVDPPIPPPDTDWCTSMCDHLKELGCEEGGPVYNNDLPGEEGAPNQSCSDNCKELQTKGFFVNPRCVSYVSRCDQIEDYRQRSPETCGIQETTLAR